MDDQVSDGTVSIYSKHYIDVNKIYTDMFHNMDYVVLAERIDSYNQCNMCHYALVILKSPKTLTI